MWHDSGRDDDIPARPGNRVLDNGNVDDEQAKRARRELVRRGYDAVSEAYRGSDGAAEWVAELSELLRPGARVLDLGCGAGIPATRELTDRGLQVIGVDFSASQLRRARRLVPAARLVQADMATVQFGPASLDAVASFYALIHLPLADQRALFPGSGTGCARPGCSWPSSARSRGRAPRTSSAPTCSGSRQAPPAT